MATTVKEVVDVQPSALAGSSWRTSVLRLKHVLGVDRAIAYTVLARGTQIIGSAGTVLLILRFLTPIEQGYYYTLLSLVSLQVVLEMGFSFVILQMAAHECAHLTFHAGGEIKGSALAHSRLASILQKTVRWYLLAAIVLCSSLLPLGDFFFSEHAGSTHIDWRAPWTAAVLATAVLFFLNPFFSFLEGCGQVWQVGRMRFGQALFGAGLSWAALFLHRGLYAPALVIVGHVLVGVCFLWSQRSLLTTLLRTPRAASAVSWRSEVWPFQWKIAVSWICSYFAMQVFTPVLFAFRGPTEAGKFGMSLSITTNLSTLMLAWVSTKAMPFGQMIARGEFEPLRQIFLRTLGQALSVLLALVAACELVVSATHFFALQLAARLVSPKVFALLLLTATSAFVVQSMAIYLRSFKREPFLGQSLAVAGLSLPLSLFTAKTSGVGGVALSYFGCTGIVATTLAFAAFRSWQAQVGSGR
jgi:hypothetical protein